MASAEGRAWACLMTNVLVLPGAGTMAAGRRLTGLAQAIVALVGFVMVCAWLVYWLSGIAQTASLPEGLGPHSGLGVLGLFLAVASWVWGLLSGLEIVREARAGVRPGGR